MDPHKRQGWHADPFGAHELRYFSSGDPTRLVRDGDVETYDEPPVREFLFSAAASPPEAGSGAARAEPSGSTSRNSRRAPGGARSTARPDPAEVSPATPPVDAPDRRWWHRTAVSTVYLVLSATLFAGVLATVIAHWDPAKKPAGAFPSGAGLAAVVARSASQTLARKTADFTMWGTIDSGGTDVELQGNGAEDFVSNSTAMTLSTSYSGAAIAVSEVVTSTNVYQQLSIGGQSMAQYLGGRHWFATPLAASSVQNSPAGTLQMLTQHGVQVVAMGRQDIGGQDCSEYSVTPARQAMIAVAQREWASLGLSSSAAAAAQRELDNATPPTIEVWFNTQRQVACALDVPVHVSIAAPAGSGRAPSVQSGHMLLTFTQYGVPVPTTPPARSDTVFF
jgi:hypothetical protein